MCKFFSRFSYCSQKLPFLKFFFDACRVVQVCLISSPKLGPFKRTISKNEFSECEPILEAI